jgi:hypothetical protein
MMMMMIMIIIIIMVIILKWKIHVEITPNNPSSWGQPGLLSNDYGGSFLRDKLAGA